MNPLHLIWIVPVAFSAGAAAMALIAAGKMAVRFIEEELPERRVNHDP